MSREEASLWCLGFVVPVRVLCTAPSAASQHSNLLELHPMHAHILIFSRDFREPLSRFLELSFCIVLSSLELCPATYSCLGLPEPQPLCLQLSETAWSAGDTSSHPPVLLGLQSAARVILGLMLFVYVMIPARNHSPVPPAVQCLPTVAACILFSFLVHSKKVNVVSMLRQRQQQSVG